MHNQSVEEQKQFEIGRITVTDDNDYIAYSNSDYSVTMDAIKNKLIDTHGGYLRVRYIGSRGFWIISKILMKEACKKWNSGKIF